MIRPATPHDIPRLIELGKLLHDTSSYAAIRYIPEKVDAQLHALIAGAGVLFVSERDGRVVGGIAGGIAEIWFSNETTAFDYCLYVDPTARHGLTAIGLIRAFEEWAIARGVKRIELGITTGIQVEATSNLFRRLGYADAGALFRKEV
jgi:GNAT superfamily N-acetyltransferase